MIDMSVEALSNNIKRLVGSLADEVVNRVIKELGHSSHGRDIGQCVRTHTRAVLLDWFLGDFIPDYATQGAKQTEGNSPAQGRESDGILGSGTDGIAT